MVWPRDGYEAPHALFTATALHVPPADERIHAEADDVNFLPKLARGTADNRTELGDGSAPVVRDEIECMYVVDAAGFETRLERCEALSGAPKAVD